MSGPGTRASGPCDAVLFDFSGTLFDPDGVISGARVAARARWRGLAVGEATAGEACSRMLQRAGSARGRALRRRCDRSREAHRAAWLAAASLGGDAPAALVEAFYECLTDPAGWRPYADTRAVMTALAARRIRVGIVSNIAFDVRRSFARAGLDHLVDAFVLSWEHGLVKPECAIFERACTALGCAPGRALMVGDDPHADGGAVALGISTYLLPALPPAVALDRNGDGDGDGTRVRGLAAVLRLAGVAGG